MFGLMQTATGVLPAWPSEVWASLGIVLGIVGIGITIYYGRKALQPSAPKAAPRLKLQDVGANVHGWIDFTVVNDGDAPASITKAQLRRENGDLEDVELHKPYFGSGSTVRVGHGREMDPRIDPGSVRRFMAPAGKAAVRRGLVKTVLVLHCTGRDTPLEATVAPAPV